MQKQTTKSVVASATIASVYAVLTLALAPISFGNLGLEFRISEALCILPIFSPNAIYGLFAGCVLSNLLGMSFSTLGLADVIFGSLATLVAAAVTYLLRNVKAKGFPFLSFLSPVFFNAVIVGAQLHLVLTDVFPSFAYSLIVIGIGEAVVVFTLGTALMVTVQKTRILSDFFSVK